MRAAYESFPHVPPRRPARRPDQLQPGQRRPLGGRAAPWARFSVLRGVAPNDQWRHLEALMDRTSGRAGLVAPPATGGELVRGSIACYPPGGVGAIRRAGPGAARRPHCVRCCAPRLWPLVSAPVRCSMATSMPCCATRTTPSTSVWRWGRRGPPSPGTACPAVPRPVPGRRRHQLVRHSRRKRRRRAGVGRPGAARTGGRHRLRPGRPLDDCVAVSVLDLTGSAQGSWSGANPVRTVPFGPGPPPCPGPGQLACRGGHARRHGPVRGGHVDAGPPPGRARC